MNAYCDRQSVDFNSIAFLFDGRRLRGEQTPDEVSSFSLIWLGCYIFFPMEQCLQAARISNFTRKESPITKLWICY